MNPRRRVSASTALVALLSLAAFATLVYLVSVWVASGRLKAMLSRPENGEAFESGWQPRPPGSWPWGKGPDSANPTGYMCLRWTGKGPTWDTLHRDRIKPSAGRMFLLVRTLFRADRPLRRGHGPACRIIITTDDGLSWSTVREYNTDYAAGVETLDLSPWTAGRKPFELAWAAHLKSSRDIRYWCIDGIQVFAETVFASNVAVSRLVYPPRGRTLAADDTTPPVLELSNLGLHHDTAGLTIEMDGRVIGRDEVVLPLFARVNVKLASVCPTRPWDEPGSHDYSAYITMPWDHAHDNDTLHFTLTRDGPR